jgi:hypothetical protein
MTDLFQERDETPTVEVRVFRHGELVHTELCESDEQAALVVEEWAELDGVDCEVDDLSIHHRPDDILGPEPADLLEEAYPDQREADPAARTDHRDPAAGRGHHGRGRRRAAPAIPGVRLSLG